MPCWNPAAHLLPGLFDPVLKENAKGLADLPRRYAQFEVPHEPLKLVIYFLPVLGYLRLNTSLGTIQRLPATIIIDAIY